MFIMVNSDSRFWHMVLKGVVADWLRKIAETRQGPASRRPLPIAANLDGTGDLAQAREAAAPLPLHPSKAFVEFHGRRELGRMISCRCGAGRALQPQHIRSRLDT